MDSLVLIVTLFLGASIALGIIVTKRFGVFSVRSLVILTSLNLVILGAIVFLFAWYGESPLAVYTVGPIVVVLAILLLCLLPSTVVCWFVRLRSR
jgi:hypothetical protein